MQGRPGYQTGALSLSFIVETGPEALAGSARIRRPKVTSIDTVQELFSGAWNEAGIQATELLAAVHRVPSGFASRKKQRLGSHLKSLQSARRFASAFDIWSSGIGAPIFVTVALCGFDRRDSSHTSVWRPNVHLGGRGTAGSRDGLAVINYSRGSMQTKAMRSASSEDIRSEARRAMRTREGKGRQRIRPSG